MVHDRDTIVARATPPGAGAIGVLRISGPMAVQLVNSISDKEVSLSDSHKLRLRSIMLHGVEIDEGLISVFKGPNSFTGEDSAELYLHGSDFITASVLEHFVLQGARLARPGEFTMRAYLNGKMDLAQAEAVADLIAAQSSGSHALALNQLKGGVSNRITELRNNLLEFAALVELELDFGEEDVEFADRTRLRAMVEGLQNEVLRLLHSFKSGNAIKEGIPVAIVGKPNAGKSTLLNAILGEERAIVTDIPGTTRDTIEEYFLADGLKYRLIDTAGIREANDTIEAIGIDRTFSSTARAALIWLVFDANSETEAALMETYQQIREKSKAEIWLVANKTDLGIPKEGWKSRSEWIEISAKKENLSALISQLHVYGKKILSEASDTTISNLRHYEVLHQASKELEKVLLTIDEKKTSDLLAFELRQAMSELGKITGEIDSEDILGEIFSKFCIGK